MKKRIVTIALVIALLATCFGGTLAYLKDTDAVKNTFTTGNVYITLDEAKVLKNTEGNLVPILDAEGNVVRTSDSQNYHLYPNMTVTKDPTITLDAKSEAAYIAAKITVKMPNANLDLMKGDTMKLVHPTHEDMLMVGGLLAGSEYVQTVTPKNHPLSGKNNMLVYGTDEYSIYQIADSANKTWTIYMFFEGAKSKGTEITLFETIKVPAGWDNAEMDAVADMTIDVQAFAAQANGFADCYTAMTTAFADQFNFN